MNEVIEKTNIEDMIYEIRGKQVMLDSDLAKLYQCKNGTKEINQAILRNLEKFPERFSFRLSDLESNYLVTICDRKNIETRGGKYKNPRVFTEQGVAMLATILKTSVATKVSIQIMDAFVEMKKYLSTNSYERRIGNIETKIIDYDNKFDEIFKKLDNAVNNHIFFEGQIYDAYSKIIDIFNIAKKDITIIDNYLDKNMLDVISKSKVEVTLITGDKLDNLDLIKYKKQYYNLNVIINESFHDRFIILDNITLYHLGSSLNSIGKKCFAITKIEDKDILNKLLDKIKS